MDGNRLYYGDNLDVLREHIPAESVDLIYLDPPFNSQATYNVLFRAPTGEQSKAQIEAFEDTWHWNEKAEEAYDHIMRSRNADAAEMLRAMRSFLRENDMMAYLAMMATRLLELHRVLKMTGSLYLHCDPTASHYLKQILDGVFGATQFKNEIIWRRGTPRGHAYTRYASSHDVILYYSKGSKPTWNAGSAVNKYNIAELDEKTDEKYHLEDNDGRRYQLTSLLNPNPDRPNLTYDFLGVRRVWRWKRERMEEAYAAGLIVQPRPGAVPRFKRYLDEQKGKPIGDVWDDISPINSQAQERLGYPTQKPLALLERVMQTSSNPGDVVLDPFCGCGTSIHAAQKLGRRWIGIDVTHLAISLIERRLRAAFGGGVAYEVRGTPRDLDGARDLAQRNKYQFQWWAGSLVDAVPYGGMKKGADSGIDGIIWFRPDGRAYEKAIVSVKGGENVGVAMIRDLAHVVEREKARIGVLISLVPPTAPMEIEAVKAGAYETPLGKYPKIQIITVEQLLIGTEHPSH
jgi:site-specific DNA-methyltransferase (adenine-specific)